MQRSINVAIWFLNRSMTDSISRKTAAGVGNSAQWCNGGKGNRVFIC